MKAPAAHARCPPDYTKPKIFRQRGLELYHFECGCPRCADDLDVYQVCQISPMVRYNAFSFVPDASVSLLEPPIDTAVATSAQFRAQIDKIYALSAPRSKSDPGGAAGPPASAVEAVRAACRC